jgi:hypothetical protein
VPSTCAILVRELARTCRYESQHTKNVMFPSLKKYVSCRRNESSILGYALEGVGPALASPVEEFTELVPVSVTSSGTFGSCMSDVIDSNETTEAELEDAGDAAGALAPQETMCGAMGMRIECWSSGCGPKLKLQYILQLNADHTITFRATSTPQNNGDTKGAKGM